MSHYSDMGSRRANSEIRSALRERIKTARQTAGLTQAQLGERAGISSVTLSKLETGVNAPTLDILLALCAALNVSPNDLVGWDEQIRRDSVSERLLLSQLRAKSQNLSDDWLLLLIAIAENADRDSTK